MDPEAIIRIIAEVTALIGAVTVLWRAIQKNTATTERTELLVNNKSDEQTARLGQLTKAMTDQGMTVPDDPAIAAAERRIAAEAETAGHTHSDDGEASR